MSLTNYIFRAHFLNSCSNSNSIKTHLKHGQARAKLGLLDKSLNSIAELLTHIWKGSKANHITISSPVTLLTATHKFRYKSPESTTMFITKFNKFRYTFQILNSSISFSHTFTNLTSTNSNPNEHHILNQLSQLLPIRHQITSSISNPSSDSASNIS